jgi:hypothetical protein
MQNRQGIGGGVLLCTFLVLAGDAAPGTQAQPPAVKKPTAKLDQYGDPLPAGAVQRLGRASKDETELGVGAHVAFSPDGKTLAATT